MNGSLKKTINAFNFIMRFFIHPTYLPELVLIIQNWIRKNFIEERDKKELVDWCQKNSISTKELIKRVFQNHSYEHINKQYKNELKVAQKSMDSCPINMGGRGDINLLYQLAQKLNVRTVVETGVAYGRSSLSLLLSLKQRGGHLYSIDMPYPLIKDQKHIGCVVPKSLHRYRTLYRTSDRIGLQKVIKKVKNIDLCHYDSDKTYYGRGNRYKLLRKILKKGGIFISDDISDNYAFYDFCNKIKKTPYILHCEGKYIGVLQK